jgi:hypothetical protein
VRTNFYKCHNVLPPSTTIKENQTNKNSNSENSTEKSNIAIRKWVEEMKRYFAGKNIQMANKLGTREMQNKFMM